MPLAIKLTSEQQTVVHLNPKTPKGKPVALDGPATWSVVDGLSTITPSEDGLSCAVISADTAGETQILVVADADLGSGVENISDTIAVTVGDPTATVLGLTVDAPTLKP